MHSDQRVSKRTLRLRLMCAWAIACVVFIAPKPCVADDAQREGAQAEGAQGEGAQGDAIKTRFIIDDADPESRVPSPQEAIASPLQMGYWVMLVSDRAEAAMKRNDFGSAAKYYRAIGKAAPDRAIGFSKACLAYEAMGDWQNAVATCETSLEKAGATVDDYSHFVRLVLSKESALSAADIADADAAIAHLETELAKSPAAGAETVPTPQQVRSSRTLVEGLKCQVGARLVDSKRLAACSRALQSLAPKEPSTIAFEFAFALVTHDFETAERLIATAKQSGLNQNGVALMQSRLRAELDRTPFLARVFSDKRMLAIVAGAIALLAVAAALLLARRKPTLLGPGHTA